MARELRTITTLRLCSLDLFFILIIGALKLACVSLRKPVFSFVFNSIYFLYCIIIVFMSYLSIFQENWLYSVFLYVLLSIYLFCHLKTMSNAGVQLGR